MISIRNCKDKILIVQNNNFELSLLKSGALFFLIMISIFCLLIKNIDYLKYFFLFFIFQISMTYFKVSKKIKIYIYKEKIKIKTLLNNEEYYFENIEDILIKKKRGLGRSYSPFLYLLKIKEKGIIREKVIIRSIYINEVLDIKKILEKRKGGNKF